MLKKNNHNFSFIRNNEELDQFITKIKNKKNFILIQNLKEDQRIKRFYQLR
jgi:hypothetical protein